MKIMLFKYHKKTLLNCLICPLLIMAADPPALPPNGQPVVDQQPLPDPSIFGILGHQITQATTVTPDCVEQYRQCCLAAVGTALFGRQICYNCGECLNSEDDDEAVLCCICFPCSCIICVSTGCEQCPHAKENVDTYIQQGGSWRNLFTFTRRPFFFLDENNRY